MHSQRPGNSLLGGRGAGCCSLCHQQVFACMKSSRGTALSCCVKLESVCVCLSLLIVLRLVSPDFFFCEPQTVLSHRVKFETESIRNFCSVAWIPQSMQGTPPDRHISV